MYTNVMLNHDLCNHCDVCDVCLVCICSVSDYMLVYLLILLNNFSFGLVDSTIFVLLFLYSL